MASEGQPSFFVFNKKNTCAIVLPPVLPASFLVHFLLSRRLCLEIHGQRGVICLCCVLAFSTKTAWHGKAESRDTVLTIGTYGLADHMLCYLPKHG